VFDYAEFTTRNLGFVTDDEQKLLRKSCVLVVGVGGMGGTALQCLVRSGIGNFIIADRDTFEISNLNRQIFCDLDVLGKAKVEVARDKILKINPELNVQVLDENWLLNRDQLVQKADLIINGCDDPQASILLMRSAQRFGKTVIDAYASTLPSVYVVRPEDPRPEIFFGFKSVGVPDENLSPELLKDCGFLESLYVLTQSNTFSHVILKYAQEMLTGQRKRISMAPMVWMTGIFMAYEAIKALLKQPSPVTYRGVFMNPYTMQMEWPRSPLVAWLRRILIQRKLHQLMEGN
jgi:molybdopterin/thiamine biosynthesis adenylyltransferase